MSKLQPNHWRYRYAAKMRAPLIALYFGLVPVAVAAFLTHHVEFAVLAIVAEWPFILPIALLGCYRCHFNVFRRYRGPSSPEHGDSYTNQIAFPVPIPDRCPKCGAVLLDARSSE